MERDTSRVKSVASLLAGIVGLVAAPPPATAQEATVRVSVDAQGRQVDQGGNGSQMSASGRHVVFSSFASNLVLNDTNGTYDVFVSDRDPDGNGVFDEGNTTMTRVSVDSAGIEGDFLSELPTISADGRFVAFASFADNLVPNDKNGFQDIFVHDRDPDGNGIFDEGNGVTTRLSLSVFGYEADSDCWYPSISADGRHVAFESWADDLTPFDLNLSADVFVRDRDPDGNGIFDEPGSKLVMVSIRADGKQADADCRFARISGNGRHVCFNSTADNLVPNDTGRGYEVFAHDRDPDGNGIFDEDSGAMARMDLDSSGAAGNNSANFLPTISDEGRYVAFSSLSDNLVPNDTNLAWDVFVRDRDPDGNGVFDEDNGVTTIMSVDSSGREGDNESYGRVSISGDGRIVAFDSYATNLAPNDTDGILDVFVHDRDPDGNGIFDEGPGVTTVASVDSCDYKGNNSSSIDGVSDDGRFVLIDSDAANLVPGDTNFATDVFVRALDYPPPAASWSNYGAGYPGTLGIPGLRASANPVLGSSIDVDIDNSLGAWTVGFVFAGMSQDSLLTKQGGTILVDWNFMVPMVIWPAGNAWTVDIPNDWRLCQVSAYVQVVEFDAGAPHGIAFTPGLELVIGH